MPVRLRFIVPIAHAPSVLPPGCLPPHHSHRCPLADPLELTWSVLCRCQADPKSISTDRHAPLKKYAPLLQIFSCFICVFLRLEIRCQPHGFGDPWPQFGFSHRWRGVKILTLHKERTEQCFYALHWASCENVLDAQWRASKILTPPSLCENPKYRVAVAGPVPSDSSPKFIWIWKETPRNVLDPLKHRSSSSQPKNTVSCFCFCQKIFFPIFCLSFTQVSWSAKISTQFSASLFFCFKRGWVKRCQSMVPRCERRIHKKSTGLNFALQFEESSSKLSRSNGQTHNISTGTKLGFDIWGFHTDDAE